MDRHKFAEMLPALLAHYPTVRSRDHYKAPPLRSAASVAFKLAGGPTPGIAAGVAESQDFQAALDLVLGKSLGQNDAAHVQRAFVRVYQEHIAGLNLEEIEEVVAQAARGHQSGT